MSDKVAMANGNAEWLAESAQVALEKIDVVFGE